MSPSGVIRPIARAAYSVNHRLPSGPAVISTGSAPGVSIGNSTISPSGLIRPILFATRSVNQRLPSGPAAMPSG